MNIKRNLLIVSLLVVLVLPTSFAFAAGIEDVKGVNYAHCPEIELAQASSLSYSGDDLYDSAADLLCEEASAEINTFSTNPELSVAQFTTDVSPVSAEINTFPANPLSFWSPQIYVDVAPASAEINTFSPNPLWYFRSYARYADAAPVSAEINTFSPNPLWYFRSYARYADAAPVSADINSFPANPLSFWSPQIYADISFESAEPKDCFADCYDNY